MKKIPALMISVLLLIGVLSGCGNPQKPDSEKLRIVTTIFPLYDWTREVLGDRCSDVELTLLLDNGVDLHSYQPTADDIIRVSSCDLFLYVGGQSENWTKDALKESVNRDMAVINLLDLLKDAVREEEMIEGMESGHEEGKQEEGGSHEIDEHVWLSLKNAGVICARIAEKLGELDPENADIYQANAASYTAKLNELDARYRNAARSSAKSVLLFGDRFPFRYLTDDYGLSYYAAFPGCSAETEASFETIMFLAKKVDALNLSCVLTLEGSSRRIAETIIQNTSEKNQQILSLDSMQSVTSADIQNGATYLSVMEKNLESITAALQ